MMAEAKGKARVTAKVIRADGTEEDLGEISVSVTTAKRVESLIRELREDAAADPAQLNEEESKRNLEETERINREARGE